VTIAPRHVVLNLSMVTCVQVRDYVGHRIDGPSTSVTATRSELMSYFEQMYRMRRMEIAADMLYKSKLIRGFCHL
jgi:pyruvate dehydrogenase E1 component alpha subunit